MVNARNSGQVDLIRINITFRAFQKQTLTFIKCSDEGTEGEVHPLKTIAKQIKTPEERITGNSPLKRPGIFTFEVYSLVEVWLRASKRKYSVW